MQSRETINTQMLVMLKFFQRMWDRSMSGLTA